MIATTFRYILRYLSLYLWGCNCKVALTLCALLSLAVQDAAVAQTNCPPGLVHHFGLDEKVAGAYTDYVSGASATCTACPAPTVSRYGGGQRFSGSNNGIQFSEVGNFQWGPHDSFTLEVWVQVNRKSANQVIVGRKSSDGLSAWWLGVNPEGYAVFDMQDNYGEPHTMTDYLKAVNLFDGKWHHLVVVREGAPQITKLYVDGFRVDDRRTEVRQYRGSMESSSPVTIGYIDIDSKYFLDGTIDELLVYNTNLSEQQARDRYNLGAGSYCGPEDVRPEIISTPITYGTVGQQYRYDVNAVGKPAPRYILLVSPPGMTIDAGTGLISWVPSAAGSFGVEVKATNSLGESTPQRFQIEVRPATEEPNGMLHHWMLNENGGPNYRDVYTPIDAVAKERSRPAAVKGAVEGGQRFNGRDTGLDVIGSPNFDWKAKETFTIELWLRTDTKDGSSEAQNQVLLGRHATDSPSQWWLGLDKDRRAAFYLPDIEFKGILVGSSGPKLNDGGWHQLVAVRDGGSGALRLYVDGEQVAAGNFAHSFGFSSRSPVTMGYFNASMLNSYHFEGDLDEVKLFGRALSSEEIRERFVDVYNNLTEIVGFKGRYVEGETFNQKTVVLDWRTLYELETNYFDVERSEDGENFTAIGQVKASGTTTTAIDYTFTDDAPLKEQGYYRLRLVRLDGTSSYSNVILVQDRSPSASSFRIYPNPAAVGDEVTLEVANLKENEEVTFMITDGAGRQVMSQQVQTDAFGELRLTLPVGGNLKPGIYNLTVAGSNKTLNRKLVIAR
ncbi:LamG-like jellyroll fold domain-containing protein [Pontibacter indicus]|uniref:Por secretion system C-terminal sorting domain-containing protein n=1 Tax=Pontibacter indicus TaxID=1317125 RepID=A0A1R3X2R1_9BACT|nr:LamG-like jellyroll fold domain-containing protein [Pontibacter indicus]SIT84985.1 Por secretion system C-terminal sorting domain-containing protein [Pontibacter indicus]